MFWIFLNAVYVAGYLFFVKNFSVLNTTAFLILLATVVFYNVLYFLRVKSIDKKIKELADIVEKFNEGDINQRFNISDSKSVGRLCSGIDTMGQNIRHLVGELSIASEQIQELCNKFRKEASETTQTSKEVASTITDIAARSENQVEIGNKITDDIDNLVKHSKTISSECSKTREINTQAEKAFQDGFEMVKGLIESINTTSQGNSVIVERVNKLQNEAEKIGKIIESVEDISEQTNLLALNAAVEAARAGEHGKGFAVVAEEVRNLANQAQDAAGEIRETIGEIRNEVKGLTKEIEENSDKIQTQTSKAESTHEMLKSLKDTIHDTLSSVEDVLQLSKSQVDSTQNIESSITNLFTLTQETAAACQQTAAASQQQAAAMEQIDSSSEKLLEVSNQLYDYVEKVSKDMKSEVSEDIKQEALKLLRKTVKGEKILSMDKQKHVEIFNELQKKFPNFSALITTDKNGHSIANSNEHSKVNDFSFRDWFKAVKQGDEYVSDVFISALTGKPTVTVALPIYKNNEFVGALTAGIEVR